MTPHQFIARWKPVTLTEMSAYQQHFLDLCKLFGVETPAAVDPTGTWFTFQKWVTTTADKKGFADVWRRGCFGWEYKGKHKDLNAAYQQLLKYREALENPHLLIVCDMDRFVIRTNFTGTPTQKYEFDLDGLADLKNLNLLRKAFLDPDSLRPGITQEQVTEEIADRFSRLADGIRDRKVEPERAAHFLVKLMFCMFAEDIGLLDRGLFTETVRASRNDPAELSSMLRDLFAKMATGGRFGSAKVAHFNGGLFDDAEVIDLMGAEIAELLDCAERDWAGVEPSLFGTLFERCLDPDKRGQLGMHYTSRQDIDTILVPVFLNPLKREWEVRPGACLCGTLDRVPSMEAGEPDLRLEAPDSRQEADHP